MFTAGQKLRASELNDALETPLFRLVRTTDLSVATNTETIVTWQDDPVDSDSMWSPAAPDQVLVNKAGVWILFAELRFPANVTGIRINSILLNSTSINDRIVVDARAALPVGTIPTVSTIYALDVGDVLRVNAYQDSGANLDLELFGGSGVSFAGAWLGALA
ncbi:MAG: hypothetical protein L0H64_13730 [Pseudonocardia sp.]|nr:hypothetical protein [Pseudonocardia sp.]